MPTEKDNTNRKLSAILSADVKGYSLLMAADEALTIKTLKEYRSIMSESIQQHSGRVVDAPGDNMLAEFSSAVEAVRCAVDIQNVLKKRNENLPDEKRLQFRIGVNVGDIVKDGDSIFGSGVNVAARIEGLADPGGICISRNAYDHIKDKLNFGYEYLGDHEVKNIKDPVRVYKVLMDSKDAGKLIGDRSSPSRKRWPWLAVATVALLVGIIVWQFSYEKLPSIEAASVEKMAYPLPDKPSIAVLPFVNMSGDSEQEYIADSISENIITALSYIPEMFVIARTSTFAYKGEAVKVKQVSEELGVRYVLEGSVMKAGDQIRVTAQLIDTISGHHLWADRYDREMEAFFDLLDEIAKRIAIELQVKLTEGDIAHISHKTENFEAWAYATKAYSLVKSLTKENNAKAKELCEKAVKLDPRYGFAWGVLGATHEVDWIFYYSDSRDKSFKLAVDSTEKALMLDETLSCATAVKGRLYKWQGQLENAIETGKKAIALGPSHDVGYSSLSLTMQFAGRFEESVTLMQKAMRLNPNYPAYFLYDLGVSYFYLERYEEANEALSRVLVRAQNGEFPPYPVHIYLSATYIELGRKEDATAHAAEILSINPKFSLERVAKRLPYQSQETKDKYLGALRKAGLPE